MVYATVGNNYLHSGVQPFAASQPHAQLEGLLAIVVRHVLVQ